MSYSLNLRPSLRQAFHPQLDLLQNPPGRKPSWLHRRVPVWGCWISPFPSYQGSPAILDPCRGVKHWLRLASRSLFSGAYVGVITIDRWHTEYHHRHHEGQSAAAGLATFLGREEVVYVAAASWLLRPDLVLPYSTHPGSSCFAQAQVKG
jgi:hypothetical protein